MTFKLTRNAVLASSTALALGLGVSALAFQVPGQAPPPPPSEPSSPDQPRDRQEETFSGVVVDLYSYVEKTEQHERDRRPDRTPGRTPGSPGTPGTPGSPGSPGSSLGDSGESHSQAPGQRPGQRPGRTPGQEPQDDEIDWTEGNYSDNIEAGVPIVIMVEEDRPWGSAEAQPHVIAFDPDDSLSRQAHEQLKNSAGEEVEVTGWVHGGRTPGGLRIIMLDDIR